MFARVSFSPFPALLRPLRSSSGLGPVLSRSFTRSFTPVHASPLNSADRRPGAECPLVIPSCFATSHLIDGELVQSSDQAFNVYTPANSQLLCQVPEASKQQVDDAVRSADAAFHSSAPNSWSMMSPRDRGACLYRLADLIQQNKQELAFIEALNNGKTLAQSSTVDVPACAAMFRYFAGWCDKLGGATIPISSAHFCYTLHQPVGVCALIVPWNLPLIAAAAKLGPALAAGNTVVLKSAENTPLTTARLAQLVKQAGFPKGVVNILSGRGSVTGAALVSHPLVRKISFTGSNATGKLIQTEAANQCKRVTLELGGKNPVVVCKDADLSVAVESVHNGLFWNEGEACASGSRIFVHESIYDEFVRLQVARAQRRKVGNPFDPTAHQGAQVSQQQMNRVLGYIESGVLEGARLELGGQRIGDTGNYLQPTIFSHVTDKMRIFREEIFGPVMCITSFKDIEEVIHRCNQSPFGLAAGVFTRDIAVGNELVRRIESGITFWNCYHVVDVSAPFGGTKESGHGREGGAYSLMPYMEVKNVVQHIK